MIEISVISNALSALLYLVPPLLMLVAGWRGHWLSGLLLLSCLVSSIWFAGLAAYYAQGVEWLELSALIWLELLRDSLWLALLLAILGVNADLRGIRFHVLLSVAACAFQILQLAELITVTKGDYLGFLLLTIVGMLLVESVYRNARQEVRWALKFLCLALGGILTYDFFMYAQALLFGLVDPVLWDVRGIVNAMVVPLLVLGIKRNPEWNLDLFVSRQVVFHSTAISAAGAYLILMAAAGYYLREVGGDWGAILQTLFFVGAVLILLLLVFSGQMRARLKIFLAKHFYRNRYEYREEWLNFTQTLAEAGNTAEEVYQTVLNAIARIMDSRGGVLMIEEAGRYRCVAGYAEGIDDETVIEANESLPLFARETGWVINLDEYRSDPGSCEGVELPHCLHNNEDIWLVIPLMQQQALVAMVLLRHSISRRDFNWEDKDLLKTVGLQSGGYLALLRTSEALAESRQFEAFNRLSAFVVHDLKNLVAQLSLISQNSTRFRDNPAFVDDAFDTVENAVGKMNRLLANLKKDGLLSGKQRSLDLREVLIEVAELSRHRQPQVELELPDETVLVKLDRDRLVSVLHNLVDNAQDATVDSGSITLVLQRHRHLARMVITDTGEGMSERFIKERLFRPFDTTKGNAGMGIGVYECREFIRSSGGSMLVNSEPGQGTQFTLELPLTQELV